MTEIRVVLLDLPLLLRDVVRSVLATRADLRVVAELTGDLAPTIGPASCDVVVSGVDSPAITGLLATRPPVPAVLIAPDGADGFVCTPTGELSPEVLLEAVRRARP